MIYRILKDGNGEFLVQSKEEGKLNWLIRFVFLYEHRWEFFFDRKGKRIKFNTLAEAQISIEKFEELTARVELAKIFTVVG